MDADDALEQIKLEVEALSSMLTTGFADNSMHESKEDLFNEVLKLLSLARTTFNHLQHLKDQSRKNRQQAHVFRLEGNVQMSVRATHLANHAERLHKNLVLKVTNAWNGVTVPQPSNELVFVLSRE